MKECALTCSNLAFREQTSLTCGWSRSGSTRRSAQNTAWSSSWPPERVRQPDAFCRPERSLGVCAVSYLLLIVILRGTRFQVKAPHSEVTTPMTACARLCCSVKKWRLLACHTLVYPPPPLSAVIERDSCLEGGSAVYTRCLRHTQLCLSPPSLMWLLSLCHILPTTVFHFLISVLKRAHFIFMTSFCAPSLKRHKNSCGASWCCSSPFFNVNFDSFLSSSVRSALVQRDHRFPP